MLQKEAFQLQAWKHTSTYCMYANMSPCAPAASAPLTTPRWTSWCGQRRARVWPPTRPWQGRTVSDGPWTTKRRESPTATLSSTSASSWPPSTSWWPSPTGTSKCPLFVVLSPSFRPTDLPTRPTFSLTFFLAHQARHRLPCHAELHAGRVGEDLLQLARLGPLPLDPGGPAGAPRQRLQLKTVKSANMRPLAPGCLHLDKG